MLQFPLLSAAPRPLAAPAASCPGSPRPCLPVTYRSRVNHAAVPPDAAAVHSHPAGHLRFVRRAGLRAAARAARGALTAPWRAVAGNFSGPKVHELVVSRGRFLELLRPDDAGRLQVVASVDTFSNVRSIHALRLTGALPVPTDCVRRSSPRTCARARALDGDDDGSASRCPPFGSPPRRSLGLPPPQPVPSTTWSSAPTRGASSSCSSTRPPTLSTRCTRRRSATRAAAARCPASTSRPTPRAAP